MYLSKRKIHLWKLDMCTFGRPYIINILCRVPSDAVPYGALDERNLRYGLWRTGTFEWTHAVSNFTLKYLFFKYLRCHVFNIMQMTLVCVAQAVEVKSSWGVGFLSEISIPNNSKDYTSFKVQNIERCFSMPHSPILVRFVFFFFFVRCHTVPPHVPDVFLSSATGFHIVKHPPALYNDHVSQTSSITTPTFCYLRH